MVSNRRVSADENSHNCYHQVRFMDCRYAKNDFAARVLPPTLLGGACTAPQTTWLLFVAIFKHLLMTGSWKNVSGIFLTNREGSLYHLKFGFSSLTERSQSKFVLN